MNNLSAADMRGLLLTVAGKTTDLKPGDLVADEFGYWIIGSVTETPKGWDVLDHFQSGMSGCKPDRKWQIVDPEHINKDRLQILCDRRKGESSADF